MKIDRHISALLFDHDCVIVPSFGGFLASYQPAQHQAIQHTFYPPSKKIAFNVFLKNNDGLLANHVARQEKLTYAEALKEIEEFRTEAMQLLDGGKRIIIQDVGTLYYDKHKNLQFEAARTINYLEEAFGLAAVQSAPVKREEQRQKIERQIRQAVVIRSSVKPEQATTGKRKSAWKIFNTAILTGALLLFAANIYLITPHRAKISSLNPFSHSSSQKENTKVGTPAEQATIVAPEVIQKVADSIDNMLLDKQPSATETEASPASAAPKEEVAAAPTTSAEITKNFFVIAGVFREPGNAEKLVNSLKQEGFAEAQIINSSAGIKKVCYNGFATREEAEAALEQIHSAKKEGWIMKK